MADKMKISFVSQYFFPEQFSNNSIAEFLVKQGHDVEVTAAAPNYPEGKFFPGYSNRARRDDVWNGVRVRRVWTIPRGSGTLRLILNFLTYALIASLRMVIRPGKPDVIFASQLSPVSMLLPAIVQKWRTGAPLVCWVQDIWPESAIYTLKIRNPIILRLLRWMSGWLYRQADLVLVQSAAFPDRIAEFGIPHDRMRVFSNSAPQSYHPLSPEEAPEQRSIVPQQGFRVMFAGNIGEAQDFDTIIAAANLLRDREALTWVIVGSGRKMAEVQSTLAEKGLEDRFVFAGRFPEEDMPGFFAHADAMLVVLRDMPIFALTVPYKVQCYLACGKPIVAALGGEGARTISASGAGLVAPPGDAAGLAACVMQMMDATPEQRAVFSNAARAYYDSEFEQGKNFLKLERWLHEVAQ